MDRVAHVQHQIRQNALETQDFLKDLSRWESSIKQRDAALQHQPAQAIRAARTTRDARSTATAAAAAAATAAAPAAPATAAPAIPAVRSTRVVAVHSDRSSSDTKSREELERERGNEHFRRGEFDAAVKSYTRVVSLNPYHVLAYSNRAMAYLRLKEFLKARADADAALRLQPDHSKSLVRRAAANSGLGCHRAALADLGRARELEPSNKFLSSEVRKTLDLIRACAKKEPMQALEVAVRVTASAASTALAAPDAASSAAGAPTAVASLVGQHRPPQQPVAESETTAHAAHDARAASSAASSSPPPPPPPSAPAAPASTSGPANAAARPATAATGATSAAESAEGAAAMRVAEPAQPAVTRAAGATSAPSRGASTAGAAPARPLRARLATVTAAAASVAAPATAYEFEHQLRSSRGRVGESRALLLALPPARLPKLYSKAGIECEVLLELVHRVKTALVEPGDVDAAAHGAQLLRRLPKCAQFDMTLMFMTPPDKQAVADTVAALERVLATHPDDKARGAATAIRAAFKLQ